MLEKTFSQSKDLWKKSYLQVEKLKYQIVNIWYDIAI